jgi:hypothetical protein
MEIIEEFGFTLSSFEGDWDGDLLLQDKFKSKIFGVELKLTENQEIALKILNTENELLIKGITYAYNYLPYAKGYTVYVLRTMIDNDNIGLFTAYIGTIAFWRALKYNADSSIKPYFDIQDNKIYYPKLLFF